MKHGLSVSIEARNFGTKALPQSHKVTEKMKRKRSPLLIFIVFPLCLCVSVSGSISPAFTASRLQIHLLPAEESAKDDLLRYAETLAGKNGSFKFKNLAPGKYWLLARPAPEADPIETQSRPLAWDECERVKLRRDAKKVEIELKSCQRIDDYALKVNR